MFNWALYGLLIITTTTCIVLNSSKTIDDNRIPYSLYSPIEISGDTYLLASGKHYLEVLRISDLQRKSAHHPTSATLSHILIHGEYIYFVEKSDGPPEVSKIVQYDRNFELKSSSQDIENKILDLKGDEYGQSSKFIFYADNKAQICRLEANNLSAPITCVPSTLEASDVGGITIQDQYLYFANGKGSIVRVDIGDEYVYPLDSFSLGTSVSALYSNSTFIYAISKTFYVLKIDETPFEKIYREIQDYTYIFDNVNSFSASTFDPEQDMFYMVSDSKDIIQYNFIERKIISIFSNQNLTHYSLTFSKSGGVEVLFSASMENGETPKILRFFTRVCPLGEGLNAVGVCNQCPAGKYKDKVTSDECYTCIAGTYSTGGAVTCTNCSAGTWSSKIGAESETDCEKCPYGSHSVSGSSSIDDCIRCPPGTIADIHDGQQDCIPCIPGTWSSLNGTTGNETCIPCVAGTWSTEEGATNASTCIECIPGTYSEVVGANNSDTCIKCPAGTYSTSPGANSLSNCTECPAGTYSEEPGADDETTCQKCPPGTYSTTLGANSSSFCIKCPPGTYSEAWGATSPDDCIPCFAGTYSPIEGAYHYNFCIPCIPGTYNELEGRTNESDCILCPAGTWSSTSGADNSSTCIECIPGTYSEVPGADNETTCQQCPPGTYSTTSGANSSSLCIRCPPGTYSEAWGATNLDYCELCPEGTYSPVEGASHFNFCISCIPGTYNEFKGRANESDCLKCPQGTWSAVVGSTSQSNCNQCPKGTYSTAFGASSPSTCISCVAGTWSDKMGAKSDETCIPCEPGTFSQVIGAESKSVCKKCPPGTFVINPGSTFCTKCRAGTYSPTEGESTEDTCIPCEEGTYSNVVGANTSATCKPCYAGTYSDVKGASDISMCKLCPEGTFSKTEKTVRCTPCASDEICLLGTSAPLKLNDDSAPLKLTDDINSKIWIQDPMKESTNTFNIAFTATKYGTIGLTVLIFILVGLILFIVAWVKLKEPVWKTGMKPFDLFYGLGHFVDVGEYPVKRHTTIGGVFTVISIATVTTLIIASIIDFVANNAVTDEVFKVKPNREYGLVSGKFSASVFVHGAFTEDCMGTITYSGFSGISTTKCEHFTEPSEILGCQCKWECTDCTPVDPFPEIYIHWTSEKMFSPLAYYNFTVPHYLEGKDFVLHGRVRAPNETYLRGHEPTVISLGIYTAQYTSHQIYNSIFDFISSPVKFGYVSKVLDTDLSLVTPATMYSVHGMAIKLAITFPNTYFSIEEFARQSLTNFIAQLFALAIGVVFGFGFCMYTVEGLILCYKKIKERRYDQEEEIPIDVKYQALEGAVEMLKRDITQLKDDYTKTSTNANQNVGELNTIRKELTFIKKEQNRLDVEHDVIAMKNELKVICELLISSDKKDR